MASETQCPRCEKLLPPSAPEGLCPECLMQAAMQSNSIDPNETLASPLTKNEAFDVTVSRSGPISQQSEDVVAVGSQLGSFKLERKLGEGGMGTVYEALDEETGRRVALKVLKHRLSAPEARTRFLREGQTAASINHPNSVYVFGTDNIDGKLIIAMELVGGGNLQDLIKIEGRLKPRRAVDAILQVIDGLEAAAKVGVLHRDVKPANCFVDHSGIVKVGDFGLSIATVGDEASFVSEEDTFLGTPAFASPEQLRGDDLDVRSDIYSVGVTLFNMVTGELPFTASSMSELMSNVLEKPAPLANSHCKEVPSELARAIARCLAKNPSDRFKDYAKLRQAIEPYSSEAPEPASLPVRGLVGFFDSQLSLMLLFFVAWNVPAIWESSTQYSVVWKHFVAPFFYYLVTESLFGRSLCKMLFGLQIIDSNGQRPSFFAVLLRTSCFLLAQDTIFVLYNLLATPEWGHWLTLSFIGSSSTLIMICMFSLARRKNGYLALHDWFSGTRVIQRRAKAADLSIPAASSVTAPGNVRANKSDEKIGPFDVLHRLDESDGVANVIGYDRRLLRKVWIREGEQRKDVSPARRELNRSGRLRWLTGSRDGSSWDAWENVEGQSLLQLIRKPQPWSRVRVWLHDLANELACAEKDGTAPEDVGLGNVWIAATGRAKLLDFRVPDAEVEGTEAGRKQKEQENVYSIADGGAHAFLRDLADRSIQGSSKRFQPIPHHAGEILERLDKAEPLQQIVDELHRVRGKPDVVSRATRCGLFAAAIAGPLMLSGFLFLLAVFGPGWESRDPLVRLSILRNPAMELDKRVQKNTVDVSNTVPLRQFIAAEFGDFVRDPEQWHDNDVVRALNQQQDVRETAEETVEKYAGASAEEIEKGRELFSHLVIPQPKSMSENEARAANLSTCIYEVIRHDRSPTMKRRLLQVYLAADFGEAIRNEENWNSYYGKSVLSSEDRELLTSYVREGEGAPQWEIDKARKEFARVSGALSEMPPGFCWIAGCISFLLLVGLPAIVAGMFFRGGLLMNVFQVDCVNEEGKPADRMQMFVRAVLWSLPVAGLTWGLVGYVRNNQPYFSILLIFVFCLIPLWSLVMMRRSLVDRMLGTYLVPR